MNKSQDATKINFQTIRYKNGVKKLEYKGIKKGDEQITITYAIKLNLQTIRYKNGVKKLEYKGNKSEMNKSK